MKRNVYFFSIIIILIGLSILIISVNNEKPKMMEIKNDEFLNSFNKINVALEKESPNKYFFKNIKLHNGDLLFLNDKNKGLDFKKGDLVEIDLSINPDGKSATGVGYILDGKYTEIFSDSIYDSLKTSFNIKEDGEYIICLIGFNANFIAITDGTISIN